MSHAFEDAVRRARALPDEAQDELAVLVWVLVLVGAGGPQPRRGETKPLRIPKT
jgi:hypothetical protein